MIPKNENSAKKSCAGGQKQQKISFLAFFRAALLRVQDKKADFCAEIVNQIHRFGDSSHHRKDPSHSDAMRGGSDHPLLARVTGRRELWQAQTPSNYYYYYYYYYYYHYHYYYY